MAKIEALARAIETLALSQGEGVAAPVLDARRAIVAAARELLAIDDASLLKPWPFAKDEEDVRYGFYRFVEHIEELTNALRAAEPRQTQAGRVIGQATAARWALYGDLLPLEDSVLDRDPGHGEWTIRRTLGHVVLAQLRYTLMTAYAARRSRVDPSFPIGPPEGTLPDASPDDPLFRELVGGSIDDIRASLDETVDVGAALLQGVDDDQTLAGSTIWSGHEVTVRFRLHRWSTHVQEHGVQIQKVLRLLDWRPREVDRLVGLLLAAYGRLEALTAGADAEALGRTGVFGQLGDFAVAHVTDLKKAAAA